MNEISQEIKNTLLLAEAKALATFSQNDINVVPVSTVKVVANKIWLIDYFFNKTRTNIKENTNVSLTFWIGLKGYQIKAKATHLTKGDDFNKAKNWISKEHPNRNVKGLVVLKPTEIFNISIHNKQL